MGKRGKWDGGRRILLCGIVVLVWTGAAIGKYSGGSGGAVSVEQIEKASGTISRNKGLELYSGYYQKNDGQVEVHYDSIEDGNLVGGKLTLTLPSVREYQSTIQAAPSWNYETVINSGPSENRIDIVVVGDGYTQSELANYRLHVNSILNGYFAQEPLASYLNFFNVHRVDVISNESGVDEPDNNIYRDTALDMSYNCGGTPLLLCINTTKAWGAASVAPDADQILALANSTRYGGAGYPDLATMAGDNSWSVELALHEFGHSFGKLADEYFNEYENQTYTGLEPSEINVSIYNAQQQTDLLTKWYRWLDLPNVDTYEGAYYCAYGIYRPTDSSKMRYLDRPFEEVNVEQFIFRIYENVSIIDDSTPLSNEPISCYTDFYVVPVEPTPNTIDIQWYIDGQPVSDANAKTFKPDISTLTDGLHEVSVTVTDNTSMVRNEIKRAQLMTKSLQWQINVVFKPYLAYVASDGDDNTGSGTFENPFATIQRGMDAVRDDDGTVIVLSGTYHENINFNGKKIVLTSTNPGDPNVVASTFIDANGSGSVVTFSSGEDANSVLAGFTITGGNTELGGGIYIDGASPIIEKNVITGNSASGEGGGIFCQGGSATIRYNKISNNYSGFVGGVSFESSFAVLQNNLIVDNSADCDSGVACVEGQPRIVNNTIAGNVAVYDYDSSGLIIVSSSQSPIINNNIIAFNYGSPGVADWGGLDPSYFRYNDVYGHPNGNYFSWYLPMPDQTGVNGNISVNPLFADTDANDYHLLSESLLIDAGDLSSDWSNEPRPNGGRINMGAYGNTSEASCSVAGDITWDKKVDFKDFAKLAFYWLQNEPSVDIAPLVRGDNIVDVGDLAVLAENWLEGI